MGFGLGQGPFDVAVGTDKKGVRGAFNQYQRMFPNFLRTVNYTTDAKGRKNYEWTKFGQGMNAGIENLANFWRNPGGISPGISAAISPLLANETDRIQRTGANQVSQATGSLARSGVGGGMAAALETAISRANSRDIATARRGAIAQSEQLRRQDMDSLQRMAEFLVNANIQHRNIRTGAKAQNAQSSQASQTNKNQQYAAYAAAIASAFA